MANNNNELKDQKVALYYGDRAGRTFPHVLPVPRPINLLAFPAQNPLPIPNFMESCGFRVVFGAGLGSVGGVLLGMFMNLLSYDMTGSQTPVVNGKMVPMAPPREQLRSWIKAAPTSFKTMARGGAILMGSLQGIECLLGKYRGKHDLWNPVLGGVIVGAAMNVKGGAGPMFLGAAFFGAFGLFTDVQLYN